MTSPSQLAPFRADVTPLPRRRDRALIHAELGRRLLREGGAALHDAELLSLVGRVEVTMPPQLKRLVHLDRAALADEYGPEAAAAILASVELGRRLLGATETRKKLVTPRAIYEHLAPELLALPYEVFHVLAFNSRNVLLENRRVATGTVSHCPVDPREVFAFAIATRAAAVVLAHNHPSGDPEPSSEDLALTRQLVGGGELLGIRVLDHLVIGDARFVSFQERGLLPVP